MRPAPRRATPRAQMVDKVSNVVNIKTQQVKLTAREQEAIARAFILKCQKEKWHRTSAEKGEHQRHVEARSDTAEDAPHEDKRCVHSLPCGLLTAPPSPPHSP